MLEYHGAIRLIKAEIFDISDTGHELYAQQVRQAKDGCGLRLCIAVNGVRIKIRFIVE